MFFRQVLVQLPRCKVMAWSWWQCNYLMAVFKLAMTSRLRSTGVL